MRPRVASALSPLWQEAAVVLLIVIRVLVRVGVCDGGAVAAALLLLAACAWAVESGCDHGTELQGLSFRAAPSPGILLGVMTVPVVMASRAAPEFWSSVACSSSLLVSLVWSIGQKKQQEVAPRRFERGENQNGLNCADFGSRGWRWAVMVFALMVVVQLGFGVGIRGVIWCIVNAAGSVLVFRSFVQAFPSCTSAGEAMLVAHGLALYLCSTIVEPLWRLLLSMVWPEFTPGGDVDPVLTIVHTIVVGMLLVPVLYRALLSTLSLEAFHVSEKMQQPILESVPRAALFGFTVLAVVFWIAPAWLRLVAGVPQHPVLWILRYFLDQPVQRLGLCVYWLLVITLFSSLLHRMTLKKQIPRIMIRKGFHIMAVVMFVPALAIQPDFLRISFALAFGVFVLVEAIRVWRMPPFGEKIHSFLKSFTDSRDSDVLVISHFSLLLGCAIPVWLSASFSNDRPLAAYAGILSLGIGDTMASVVGYNFGSMRLSRLSNKTWEGTVAGILSILAASVLLSYLPPTFPLDGQIGSMAVAAICAGLVEAFTSQLDNAFVPIVYYSLLAL